jgi:hypothetical protein
LKRILGRREGGTEGVSHGLEDVSIVPFYGITQDGVMPPQGSFHFGGVGFPAFG